MPDLRFYTHSGAKSLEEILTKTGARLHGSADNTRMFNDIAALDVANAEHVSFLDNPKYISQFKVSKAGACFVREKFTEKAPAGMLCLVTEEPYAAFAITSALFYPYPGFDSGISAHAFVDASAEIDVSAHVGPGAVIGKRARIGKRVHIGANVLIGDGVVIGDDCTIGANSTISHTIIGMHAIIHRGVHIGQDGFGFAPIKKGIVKVPQLGRVMIGDHVEIGSGTCIDRGSVQDTVIGSHTKIDNLVQIAHNCRIGSFVFIAGQAGIGGSTVVEDGAWLGGQAGLGGHLTLGKGAKMAAQSGTSVSLDAGGMYGGTPAQPLLEWQRGVITLQKLTKGKKND